MSARSTGTFSFTHTYCWRTREPQVCSMLKLTAEELSVAENSRTGIETRPKLRDSDAIDRAAMGVGRAGGAVSVPPRACRPARMRHARHAGAQLFALSDPRYRLGVVAGAVCAGVLPEVVCWVCVFAVCASRRAFFLAT